MVQKKYLWGSVGLVIVLAGLGSGGYLLLASRHQSSVNDGLGADLASSSNQTTAGGVSGQNIPLTPAPSNGLSANSSPTTGNLGQLSQQTNSNNNSGSGGGGSSSSSQNQGLDPSTFSQYDKYQNGNSPLFGDMQVGNGTTLTSGHQATVYYKGWLTNGTLFDESRTDANGQLQPFSFTVGAHQVIAGWEQGLVGMKVGGVRLLVVPPAVGYGANGQGPIPPNAVLVFEVQLLKVQ